ncbi:MAG: hypothetical protein BPHS0_19 [Phage 5P_3]|nr:MAG: hypothetical protein BPHS0_19 [Phage 5P_3]
MSDELHFTPGDTVTELDLYKDGNENYVLLSEDGWDTPDDAPIVAETPDAYEDTDQGVGFSPRVYTVKMAIIETPTSDPLDELIRDWNYWHAPNRGVGVIRRVTDVTRYLDVRPQRGKFGERGPNSIIVEQPYFAANPWWYGAEESANGTFNADTPVTIAIANAGWLPARPWIKIVGVAHTPKLTYDTSRVIEVNNATVNADDILVIDCRLGRPKITYWVHGTGYPNGGASWYGWRTHQSQFGALPVGNSNVTIVGATGETSTAACTVYWTPRYGSL